MRYIKLDEKWLKKLRETAHFYGADIVCGAGTDWVLKTAEAENKELFAIISYLENAPSEDVAEAYATLHAAYTELTRTCMTLTEKVKVLNEQYDALLDRNMELGDEVADWKAIAEQYQRQFEDCAEDRARLTEENERLREDNEIKSQRRANMYEILDAHKRGRADAVWEMAERLKAELKDCCRYIQGNREYFIVGEPLIDQIAQEMLEVGKNAD